MLRTPPSPAPSRQIELLQEYRTRLIADVVTGKLDVREASAQLPDERDDGSDPPFEEANHSQDGEAEDSLGPPDLARIEA